MTKASVNDWWETEPRDPHMIYSKDKNHRLRTGVDQVRNFDNPRWQTYHWWAGITLEESGSVAVRYPKSAAPIAATKPVEIFQFEIPKLPATRTVWFIEYLVGESDDNLNIVWRSDWPKHWAIVHTTGNTRQIEVPISMEANR